MTVRIISSDECKKAVDNIIAKAMPLYRPHNINSKKVKEAQKKLLGDFCPNEPLPYGMNPRSLNLSMFGQVLKKFPTSSTTSSTGEKRKFSEYIDIGTDPNVYNHHIITMVARSGSGKTATMISLSEKHFVIYALCTFPGSSSPDFIDTNFSNLAKEVSDMPNTLQNQGKFDFQSKESLLEYDAALKIMAMNRVTLEFLARHLFLLLLFKANPQLQPSSFFREQTNGGQVVIADIVRNLRQYDAQTIRDVFDIVNNELKEIITNQGRALVIALDEAHVAGDQILPNQLISPSVIRDYNRKYITIDRIFQNNKIRPENLRGFLIPLYAALDTMRATTVFLGTKFSLLNTEHVYPAYSKPNERGIQITDFPFADENDVGAILTSLLNMDNCEIPLEKKQRLAGRFRFTTYIIDAITRVQSRDTKTKQQILDEAVSVAIEKAKMDAMSDVENLLISNNREINIHLLCRMLIAFKLKNGHITFPQESLANFVNRSLCVLVQNQNKYSYTMTEPLIAEAVEEVLKKRGINAEFFEYFDQLNAIFTSYNITSSAKGEVFERLIGESLKRFNGKLIKDLPFVKDLKNLPAWCGTITFQVDSIKSGSTVQEDLDYLCNPPVNEGRYPHHLARQDYFQSLKEKEYWLSFASKLDSNPVPSLTNNSNTLSSDIRLCFVKQDGSPNEKAAIYRQIFQEYGYPKAIKGILRIHFVFPSVEGGTPQNYVKGEDVFIYIDINNMNTFFDESIEKDAGHMRTIKKMIRYMVNSEKRN